VPPDELRRSDLLGLLDAEVVCTGLPTNTISGRELDYFVVSKCLLGNEFRVELEPRGAFSPHVAVRLSIDLPRDEGITRRLRQPRILPIERPFGPLREPQYRINWEQWIQDGAASARQVTDHSGASTLNRLTREWYAGAEVELIEAHGIDVRDGAPYSGLGQAPVVVASGHRGRFRSVPDELGLRGQRLAWSAKALWNSIALMGSPVGSEFRTRALTLAWSMSHRARAYRRELDRQDPVEDASGRSSLRKALALVGSASLTVHGIPPSSYGLLTSTTGTCWMSTRPPTTRSARPSRTSRSSGGRFH
jgi:hypothetical protein